MSFVCFKCDLKEKYLTCISLFIFNMGCILFFLCQYGVLIDFFFSMGFCFISVSCLGCLFQSTFDFSCVVFLAAVKFQILMWTKAYCFEYVYKILFLPCLGVLMSVRQHRGSHAADVCSGDSCSHVFSPVTCVSCCPLFVLVQLLLVFQSDLGPVPQSDRRAKMIVTPIL